MKTNRFGVSYRYPNGPRGGRKKPIVYYRSSNRIGQMEALWRCQEYHKHHKTNATIWEWEN